LPSSDFLITGFLLTIIVVEVLSLLAACLLHLSQDLQLSQQDGLLDRLRWG
jgi:hypothetical protein